MAINLIIIHCAASKNGVMLGTERQTAAERIDEWHAARGFARRPYNISKHNPHLHHIGYHYVIDADGSLMGGRAEGEPGAHVKGHNTGSLGICLAGTDAFTRAQWQTLAELVQTLAANYPDAAICGHRDLSPDSDGDGTVEPHEWLKTCPGFDVADWLQSGMEPLPGHITELR